MSQLIKPLLNLNICRIVLYSFLNNDSLAIVCIVNILIRQTWAFILWRPMSIFTQKYKILFIRLVSDHVFSLYMFCGHWKKCLYLSHCLSTKRHDILNWNKVLINAFGQAKHIQSQLNHYNFQIWPQSEQKPWSCRDCLFYIN